MIDTHTHLYLPDFAGEDGRGGIEAVDRAISAGVEAMVMPNVDLSTVEPLLQLCAQRPEAVHPAMGLHPTEVGLPGWEAALESIMATLRSRPQQFVAVGEVGIDLYWDPTHRSLQRRALTLQARAAMDLSLPIIIHSRSGRQDPVALDALADVLDALDDAGGPPVPVVFHSFGGSVADVERIRSRVARPWFGVNGVLTFKNSALRSVLPAIGADALLLETDAPYLAPVPHRGKRNESAYLVHTAAVAAAALGMTLEELDAVTTANARALFALG